MKIMALLSRHTPTPEQTQLAEDAGYRLIHVGDADAFTVDRAYLSTFGDIDCVAVVHPAAALRLWGEEYEIAVFENGVRPAEGQKPSFFATKVHLWR